MRGGQGVDGESLGENSDDPRQVGVVGAEDGRVVGLDEVAEVAVDVRGLVDVL